MDSFQAPFKKNIKKKKFKIPLSLEFISNFSFVFNPPAPFLHICEKTSYPELFKLTKSQLSFSFAIHERKEKSTLNFSFTFNLPFQKNLNFHHHSSSPIQHKLFHQIIHERNNHRIYFQRLSRSLSLFFRSFRESISTFLYPSGAIVRPLSKKGKKGREKKRKKESGKPTMIKDRTAIRQSVLSRNIIGSYSIDFTVGVYLSRDSKRNAIVLAHRISIEFSLHRFFKIGSIWRKAIIGD